MFVVVLVLLGAVGGAIAMYTIPPADRPSLPDNRSVVFVAVFASLALGSVLYALWQGFTSARDESGSNAAVGCVMGLLMMAFGPIVTPVLIVSNLVRTIALAILLVIVKHSQTHKAPAGQST